MKIAIIGTGIAGLTAGWRMRDAGHEVVLLERLETVGLDAHCVDLAGGIRAEIPPRMFNSQLWPSLSQLYQAIGVELEAVSLSQSFGMLAGQTCFKFGKSFAPQATLSFLFNRHGRQIVRDIRRMQIEVPRELSSRGKSHFVEDSELTLFQWLKKHNYSEAFIFRFLFPTLASTVCTCSYDRLKQYPAELILKAMLALTTKSGLYRARFGSADVANRLNQGIGELRLGTTVQAAVVTENGVRISLHELETLHVDHLIVATQANSAAQFLPNLSKPERAMLETFEYESIEVVLHRDPALMPARKKDWSDFNMMTGPALESAMCTVWMNRFCPDWQMKEPIFQTIMPISAPAEETVICTRRLQRPVVNQSSLNGLKLLADLHNDPDRRIWFCGSYASAGVPLLESGVVSGMAAAQKVIGDTAECFA